MKIYFDNTTHLTTANCEHLSKNGSNTHWLTSPGTRLKQELRQLAIPYYNLKDIDEPGLYFVEVNNDPIWWCGLCESENGPSHILYELPNDMLDLVREKKLRLIISADREGGGMIFEGRDGFKATTDAMQQCNLPVGSILIIQGNSKIENASRKLLEAFFGSGMGCVTICTKPNAYALHSSTHSWTLYAGISGVRTS
jgi:hypothetical protein